ncbi:MAG: hypothetical protein MUF58_02140 [Arcicella sp.]|jgi:hypothetical protein|nr:hypothetical protein [Arcicella sp.]
MRDTTEIQLRIAEIEQNIINIYAARIEGLKIPFFKRDRYIFNFWYLEERVNRARLEELRWFLEKESQYSDSITVENMDSQFKQTASL